MHPVLLPLKSSACAHWCSLSECRTSPCGACHAECHKAKNLVPESGGKPTKVGEKVLQLQRMLPLARVVYCSATGAPCSP